MATQALPLVISAPEPRTLDLIFTPDKLAELRKRYRIVEADAGGVASLPAATLGEARYIVGQPPISPETLDQLKSLRCVFNVETNLINNMPYETLFQRGIYVVTPGAVFAEPVAEMGLALALNLARNVVDADLAFRNGKELWGGDGNQTARLISGSDIGIIGFGDLGKALNRVLSGFRARIRVFDPWLPPSILIEHGVEPASLDKVLAQSDYVFVVAAVTSENEGFLGRQGIRENAAGRCLHPAQPRRRGRFSGADGGGQKRAYRCRQRRISRRAAGEGPSGAHPARLPALRAPRRRAGLGLQEDGRHGAGGHGPDGPRPAADALQARRTRDRFANALETRRQELTGAGATLSLQRVQHAVPCDRRRDANLPESVERDRPDRRDRKGQMPGVAIA